MEKPKNSKAKIKATDRYNKSITKTLALELSRRKQIIYAKLPKIEGLVLLS